MVGFSYERRRSNTYSGPGRRSRSPSHMSSSPPPSLLTLSEEDGEKRGRGRGVAAKVNSDGHPLPSRPPPPARARSLPRGEIPLIGETALPILVTSFRSRKPAENVGRTERRHYQASLHNLRTCWLNTTTIWRLVM